MKTYLSHTVLRAVRRLADAPENTLARLTARFATQVQLEQRGDDAPDHIMMRLESAFEALSELPFQPDINAALELACDTLQAELPSEAIAAGLYNINADEVRIVAARGLEHDLTRGLLMPLAHCFAGRSAEAPVVTSGAAGARWLGSGEESNVVLLCPIAHEGHLLGVLAIAGPLCADGFEDHDIELVSYVASQLSAFIQTLRQRPSLPAPSMARGA